LRHSVDQKPQKRLTSHLTCVLMSWTSHHTQTLVFLPLGGGRSCIYVKLSSSVSIFNPSPRCIFTSVRFCTDRVAPFLFGHGVVAQYWITVLKPFAHIRAILSDILTSHEILSKLLFPVNVSKMLRNRGIVKRGNCECIAT